MFTSQINPHFFQLNANSVAVVSFYPPEVILVFGKTLLAIDPKIKKLFLCRCSFMLVFFSKKRKTLQASFQTPPGVREILLLLLLENFSLQWWENMQLNNFITLSLHIQLLLLFNIFSSLLPSWFLFRNWVWKRKLFMFLSLNEVQWCKSLFSSSLYN